MVKAICNFCTKFRKTYKCRIGSVDYEYHACKECINTLPIGLVPLEAINEDENEGEQEVEESGL